MLSSFEIVNFRTFRHLRIERLGRVNLVVGQNGVGKTTLLEALRVYGTGSPIALREYLADQQEWSATPVTGETILNLQALFHGRIGTDAMIEIGASPDDRSRLQIGMVDLELVETSSGYEFERVTEGALEHEGEIVKGLEIRREGRRALVYPLPSRGVRGRYAGPAFIPACGPADSDLSFWWEELDLLPSEKRVLEMIGLLEPVEAITTVQDPRRKERGHRMFKARLRGDQTPVPLRSLGGGLVRVFQIAVALEYAYVGESGRGTVVVNDGGEKSLSEPARLLLVDEIENGIHYARHADLWNAIFRIARHNDVQVFATTHSWDCIEGFQAAAAHWAQSEGMLIRLESGRGKTRAVAFGEDELSVVTRDRIEVR